MEFHIGDHVKVVGYPSSTWLGKVGRVYNIYTVRSDDNHPTGTIVCINIIETGTHRRYQGGFDASYLQPFVVGVSHENS
jgi:hypothetical protein